MTSRRSNSRDSDRVQTRTGVANAEHILAGDRANAAQLAVTEKLGNQAATFEARLRVVSNERRSSLERISVLEAEVESLWEPKFALSIYV
ncbi:BnaAnng09560D [Brassica napus]|uniref:BnaAnng09560D protein n=2 Tax=Brassica TaxID=3705 RepID=A0A078IE09_BRANA|nr:BnaAnng09560D [Brassica napus]